MTCKTIYQSPVGRITLASDGKSLIGLWNQEQKYHGDTIFKNMTETNDLPIFNHTKDWLTRYFEGEKPDLNELPLAPKGSEFRQAVWQILCEIPCGKVLTYGDIARKMAIKMNKSKMSCQAIGEAVGHNPISIIIPCHRVVGANGSLTGYAGGIETKIKLLELEGVDMTQFFVPSKGTAL